jgi:hypothetical protein
LDRRHSLADEPSFPLTLTLSLGEREETPPGACFAHTGVANSVAGTVEGRPTILPLPRERAGVRGKKMQSIQRSHQVIPNPPFAIEMSLVEIQYPAR